MPILNFAAAVSTGASHSYTSPNRQNTPLNNRGSFWASVTLLDPGQEERRFTRNLFAPQGGPVAGHAEPPALPAEAARLFETMAAGLQRSGLRPPMPAVRPSDAGPVPQPSDAVRGCVQIGEDRFAVHFDPASGLVRVGGMDGTGNLQRRSITRIPASVERHAEQREFDDLTRLVQGHLAALYAPVGAASHRASGGGKKTRDDVERAMCHAARGELAHRLELRPDGDRGSCDFSGWDLAGADLSGLRLENVNFSRADLAGANLQSASLRGANLTGAILSNADLGAANLCNAYLGGAILCDANLERAWLTDALLNGADLSGAVLSRATLVGAELYGARLVHADLRGARLNGAGLIDVDLSGASLAGALVRDAVFTGATLKGADLSNIQVGDGTCLANMQLDGVARFELDLGVLKEIGGLDRVLHHRNNGTGLFLSIDAIRDSRAKVHAMAQLIQTLEVMTLAPPAMPHFSAQSLSAVRQCALDVLIPNPLYREHDAPLFEPFMARCCLDALGEYNGTFLPADMSVDTIAFHLRVASVEAARSPAFAQVHGIGIMQLVFRAQQHAARAPALGELADRLRRHYMNSLPQGLQLATLARDEADGESYFPLVAPEATRTAVLMSSDYFRSRIVGEALPGGLPQLKWEMLWVCEPAPRGSQVATGAYASLQVRSLRETLRPYPMLFRVYQAEFRGAMRDRYLAGMRLGAFAPLIASAMEAPTSAVKLVALADQEALARILGPCYEGTLADSRITDSHLAEICRAFPAFDTGTQTRAYLLLCLSVVFARLSSSHFFGTHEDSPHALRQYAASLLTSACEIDPGLVPASVSAYWQDELRASSMQAFTCTAVVSNLMLNHVRDRAAAREDLNEIHAVTWPTAWR